MPEELVSYLQVCALLWLRCAPLFLLAPYLAVGAAPGVLGVALSGAFAFCLTPLVVQGCLAQASCTGVLSHALQWGSAARALLVGVVVAFGFGLPGVVLRTTGAITQALSGLPALGSAATNTVSGGAIFQSQLGRAAGLAAVVAAAIADALSGLSQLLLSIAPPLGAADLDPVAARELLLPMGQQLLRAFALGVSFSAPLLLGAIFAALLFGLLGRLGSARLSPVAPALLPWLGLGLVSLCVTNWLDSVPQLVRAFAQSMSRLLSGLP